MQTTQVKKNGTLIQMLTSNIFTKSKKPKNSPKKFTVEYRLQEFTTGKYILTLNTRAAARSIRQIYQNDKKTLVKIQQINYDSNRYEGGIIISQKYI